VDILETARADALTVNTALVRRIDDLEAYSRQQNVIIRGLPE